jgi:hypothetical protein
VCCCLVRQGPENGQTEIACQTSQGSAITTGGGFSRAFPLPAWQRDAVGAYLGAFLQSESAKGLPAAGYPRSMRGYPDVSLLANKFVVAAQDKFFQGKDIITWSLNCALVKLSLW